MRLGHIVLSVLGGAFVCAALVCFRVETLFAVGWAFLAVAVIAAFSLIGTELTPLPLRIERPSGETGTRSDVRSIGWSIDRRTGLVRDAARKRLRRLVTRVLLRHSIDISQPGGREAAIALLGEPSVGALEGSQVTLSDITDILHRIERVHTAPHVQEHT
ncbi:hypothetical protein [Microbacterium amylolyticum]|uniref:PH domain-containing protein n=1 Tax=Microbacterium amylolyticum TaxID=936337 RepID=A0ABS4ZKL9_9MICO|nr:hypothetical protein [Microbacterium amylolyticum]MBP2437834.1 hypothetical protein [Microbacterium amylolyticum]